VTQTASSPRRAVIDWSLCRRVLSLGKRTQVMGVVNITPDSFSDGGLYLDPASAVDHALKLLDDGADLLDLGAESTRPGSLAAAHSALSAGDEQSRLLPVLKAILRARPSAIISVDTYKSATARAAIAAGAEIVNDVSGCTWDAKMAATCAELGCGVVLMHTRGTPGEWRTQSRLQRNETLPLVRDGLAAGLVAAEEAGISRNAIVLDPGYGFGKVLEENYDLLSRQGDLLSLGRPLLAGLSRKSFLVRTVQRAMESRRVVIGPDSQPDQSVSQDARETASVAAMVTAILKGASIVRVHQVRSAVQAAAVADAVLDGG